MPSFAEALRRDIDRLKFAAEEKKKPTKKKGKKVRSPVTDKTLKHGRDMKLIIRRAATGLFQIQMVYKKDTTAEIKSYRLAPYSYRYRFSKKVRKRMLFAYDMEDKHIKGFVVRNILKVSVLEKKFRPKWPVEIA